MEDIDEVRKVVREIYDSEGKVPDMARLVRLTGVPLDVARKTLRHMIVSGEVNTIKENFEYVENQREKRMRRIENISVRAIMGFVGVILVVVSIHFTYRFNNLAMNRLWSLMLSMAMILFTSLAFTVASIIGGKTSKVIYALWAIGVLYSIFTAIAGQYNDFRKYNSSDRSVVVEKQHGLLESQLKDLVDKRDMLIHWRVEESEYTSNPDLKEENPSTWRTIRNGVESLNETERKIENVREKMSELSEINVEESKTIYHWLSRVTHIPSDLIQFIIIVFPSIFLDLCSGICLKFAFVSNKKVDDKNKR